MAGVQDDARILEPCFVRRDPVGGHPEIAGVAEIGAEGLLGTAGQVALLDGGQIEDGLSPAPLAVGKPDGTEPSAGFVPPDPDIEDGQPPYGDDGPEQSRITNHVPDQGRDRGGVGQTTHELAGSAKLRAVIAELPPLNPRPVHVTVTLSPRQGAPKLQARCRLSRRKPHRQLSLLLLSAGL